MNGDAKTDLVTDAAIRQRITSHSTDLRDYYFSMRSKAIMGDTSDDSGLNEFSTGMG